MSESRKTLLKHIIAVLLLAAGVILLYMTVTSGQSGSSEHTSAAYATILSIVPPLLAIVLALITKEVYSSLLAGIIVGALLYANGNLELALETMLYDETGGLVANVATIGHSGVLIFCGMLFMLVYILNQSGSAEAFGKWASTHVKTRTGAQLATILLGLLIFVDDGFNCMTVGSVMRPLTDREKISRAKLAYIIDSTAAPICIIAPISSWAAAVTTSVPEEMGINGFQMFIRLIPLNLYPLVTLLMLFLVVLFQLDYGPMKKYEANAENGDLFTVPTGNETASAKNDGNGKVSNTVLPLLVLIGFSIWGMLDTGGFFQGVSLMEAFADCDAVRALVTGAFISLLFTFALYMLRGVMGFRDFMECIPNGLKTMCGPMIILILAWNLSGITQLLGIAVYIHDLVEATAGGLWMFLPFMIFLISVGLSFASGTSWGTFTILIPIICTVFEGNETMLMISMAACLSGSVCGDHCSPISDTTIMSSAGAGCDHISHVVTQLPYALTAAGVSAVGFLISGILGALAGTGAALAATPITFVLLILVLLGLRQVRPSRSEFDMDEPTCRRTQ
ncbi:MAG: Na+/H+ antiporter NhaC family protein [Clostridiales bacterium]|nr:Na+/H+ antiporter NhaC family protein [Clostridiales bacterium]